MIRPAFLFAALTASVLPVVGHASQELAQKNACLACHAMDKKLVGPAYADVAKKYAGQKDAEATLAASIKKGGSGKWGPIPMLPQSALSEADAKTLAKWILSAAK
ncbi:MAG: c-type cytochrome [Ideonella sp.]|nr:c-type cytochrome [Ideonella sp.]